MEYADFKDLPRGTASEKILCDKALNVAKNKKKKWWMSSRSCFNGL